MIALAVCTHCFINDIDVFARGNCVNGAFRLARSAIGAGISN